MKKLLHLCYCLLILCSTKTLSYAQCGNATLNLADLDGTNGFTLNGINAEDYSGWSVSGAGDINGDGIDDVIIGARSAAPNGAAGAGETYVVFGTTTGFPSTLELSSLNGTNGFILNGIDSGDFSGWSVSGVGDINGDSIDDIIIGANYADSNGLASGESYVVFGSTAFTAILELSNLDGTNGFTLNGIDGGDVSGNSVNGAGDINGDGIDDIIIGASEATLNGTSSVGETYVVFGSSAGFSATVELSSLNGTNGFTLNGIDSSDFSGFSVSGAGDINDDGIDDIIIGAFQSDPNGSNSGETYIVFGTTTGFPSTLELSSLNGTNGFILNGIDSEDFSGWSVSGVGDINGDGIDDIIIGANRADSNGNSNSGESYVVFGSTTAFPTAFELSSLDGTNGFTLNGIDTEDNSGYSVSGAGDMNGDGIDDIIIGAYRADSNGNSNSGESYVVFGSTTAFPTTFELSNLDGTNGFVINGFASNDLSGRSVSDAGDVNGDGIDDIIIGAYQNSSRKGKSYVVFGQCCPENQVVYYEDADNDGFGNPAVSIGICNQPEGYVTNATDCNDNDNTIGEAGTTCDDGDACTENDVLQADCSCAGTFADADNDGTCDAEDDCVGVYDECGICAGTGETIWYEDADNDGLGNSEVTTLSCEQPTGYVANADDIDDTTVSCFNPTLNLADLDGTNGFTLNGIDANDISGLSVSGAGDINGDGIDDMIIGASEANPNGGNSGESYVVFGTVTGFSANFELSGLNGTNGFTLNGIGAGDFSGQSVSEAGDVNGDGIDDIIIGAKFADPNGNASGESYVVFGKTTGFSANFELSNLDGTNGFILNGIDGGDNFGNSVSGVGDINGDGIDDIIIGAPDATPNGSDSGQTYIIFGSSTGFSTELELSTLDGTNGFTLNGIAPGDVSGFSVSEAGDVNGDGIGDIIIGAYGDDSNSGETYVIFGSSAGFPATMELSSLNGTNGFTLNGIDTVDFSGQSVSEAGDVNGDGIDDIIIGAYAADPNGNASGETYVVFGNSTGFPATLELSSLDGTNGFTLNGIDVQNRSGFSVSSAGDVNGDDIDDMIIGAYRADPNGTDSGETYVVFGNSSGFPATVELSSLGGTNGFTLNGIDAGDYSGVSVSGAGDVNGDGIDDIIIGAYAADPNGTFSGETYVVFGQCCPENQVVYYEDADNDGFGNPAVSIGVCNQPEGFVTNADDCDDTNGSIGAVGTACDDGDACTENDTVQADCSCAGTPADTDNDGVFCADDCDDNDASIGTIGSTCDDGDACTENDVLQADCSCAGTFADADNDGTCDAEDICADSPEPGTACDDGNDATFNDVIQSDCSCLGSEQDCEGVVGGSANEGSPCDDGDACTENDVYQADCSCAGTPIDADNDGAICAEDCDDNDASIGAVGSTCDDGDACTVNDVLQDDCSCAGTFADADNDGTCDAEDICADSPEPGTACDDGNDATFNDVIQSDCSCLGSEQDCEGVVGGSANEGSSCDDGDACTENDVYQADCSCAGTPIDADNDGAFCAEDCDDNDASIGAVGSTCDDGDACTENDVLQADCSCAGTFADADNDGTCDADDICADSPEPGTACDDGDAATQNDMIQADCTCVGSLLDCAGVVGGSSTTDECGVCDDNPNNDNETCTDCAGVINGGAQLDECGICEGTGIAEGTCDCDGTLPTIYYADTDNDGLGDPNNSAENCTPLAGYVLNSNDLDDTVDDSICEQPIINITTNCINTSSFEAIIEVVETGSPSILIITDTEGTITSVVPNELGSFSYGTYSNNTTVEVSIITNNQNCEYIGAVLEADCFEAPTECTLEVNPTVQCNDNGTYNVAVAVAGGSGNYAFSFAPNGNYIELSGSEENGFQSGSYTDGDTYYISVIDNDTDCEVVIQNTVECSKTAIELVSFEGRTIDNANQLQWVTASETENDYFNLMRSIDGVSFEAIAKIKGAGNSSSTIAYEFIDREISTKTSYYRLDIIDYFGKVETSSIIELSREALDSEISIVPNPATDFINIDFNSSIEQELLVKIFDVSGKLIKQQNASSVVGNNRLNINLANFNSGLYFLQLEGNDYRQQATFIVD